MTSIYLIRHAEAEGNLYRRAQGQYNSNLTALGRRQVAALAERFRRIPIDALWASDLHRTQSTASAILKYHPNLTLHTTPALREVDVGTWEDRPWAEIARDAPEQMELFLTDPARWRIPGGEDYGALVRRMEQAVLDLAAAYPGKTLAAVSHAFVIRALLAKLLGVPHAQIPYGDNTAVSRLTVDDGRISVDFYNDSSHLEGTLRRRPRPGGMDDDALFAPISLPAEEALFSRCYSETWMASHGDLRGYSPVLYLHAAAQHSKADPRCLVKMLRSDGALAGVIELDPQRGAEEGAGWISLLYVQPELRSRRFGAQLMGHAVSYFRGLGRRTLRLHVSQTNEPALAFYKSMGFETVSRAEGVGGPLYLMEMPISQEVWYLP